MAAVLAALAGVGEPPDPRVLAAPSGIGIATPAPPGGQKGPYGSWSGPSLSTDNFFIVWTAGQATAADAQLAADALEATWAALVEDAGWKAPVSSDEYLLWVVMDTGLSGTGLTTEYTTDLYPDGYPVIYLNPYYSWDPDFFTSLSAHELNHALQYARRTWTASDAESWYWEASAEWGAELALPDVDAYAAQSTYYASYPWYTYSSTENYHQYGMFVLNAYIEEYLTGAGGMADIWALSESRTGVGWDAIIAESVGADAGDIWAGFSAAMGNNALRESALYVDVLVDGDLSDGLTGRVAYLGCDYFSAPGDFTLTVTSPSGESVLLASPQGHGTSIQVRAGDIVGVTGTSAGTAGYTLALSEPVEEPLDTGDPDSGDPDTDSPDSGDSGETPVSGPDCGCASGGGAGGLLWLAGLLVGLRRRRGV